MLKCHSDPFKRPSAKAELSRVEASKSRMTQLLRRLRLRVPEQRREALPQHAVYEISPHTTSIIHKWLLYEEDWEGLGSPARESAADLWFL